MKSVIDLNRPKVLILYNILFHYRIPIWNCLAEKCDLTVAYSLGSGISNDVAVKFKVLRLPAIRINKFVIQKNQIRRLASQYDVIIAYGDIAWLKYSILPWFNKQKIIFHTIGVSADYGKGYDKDNKWDHIRYFFYKKASALAFYSDYPIEKYEKLGIPRERMFVAHNTVAVHPQSEYVEKDSILFIGTLYKQKGIHYLLEAYKDLKGICNLPVLNIIGKGPDFDFVKKWIVDNKMENLINLVGAVYDIDEKAQYFAKAYACVSPLQAGLTVQESMGYGVPFVTIKDAITGGEIFDIANGETGVLMNDIAELPTVIQDIAINPEKYEAMGKKAYEFYHLCRKPSDMAEGLWQAVCYALNQ